MNSRQLALASSFGFFLLFVGLPIANASTLSLSPSAGAFVVGSTFEVAIFLDTQGESINVVDIELAFPPDKLQLVSPTTGKSIIEVWTAPPKFNNQAGIVSLQGGIPGGINVSQSLVTRLSFRVKNVGTALVRFSDKSRVLLNDGKGTEALRETLDGVYTLILPPPAGPIVASETHPNQSVWYSNSTVILKWTYISEIESYSYMLSDQPADIPDDISEGMKTGVAYKNLSNGTHYFHIKALRDGSWGGITHFAINVDTEPPAEFPIKISPSARTTSRQPILIFGTTDVYSGIDHYEYEVVDLNPGPESKTVNANFFIEADSPQILSLAVGSYDVIVRAYDWAKNFREVIQRLNIVTPLFQIITGKGLRIGNMVTLPWTVVWFISLFLIAMLGYGAWRVYGWYQGVLERSVKGEMPEHIKNQLRELKTHRQRYGRIAVLLLILGSSLVIMGHVAQAQQLELAPPFISTVSRNISNEEIFYIGGKTDAANVDVIVYLQNLQTGETLSEKVSSDKKGEWFYRHPTFLSVGNYLLWIQSKLGEQLSPPSPQIQMNVTPTALQFGASRLSYEMLYLIILIVLFLAIVGLVAFIIVHGYRGRRKHRDFLKEVKEAEESIRRGFAVLRRDIQAELEVVRKAQLSQELSAEEKKREEQLLRDLDWVQKYIGKEVWDVERTETQ